MVKIFLASFEGDNSVNEFIDYRLVSYYNHKNLDAEFWEQSKKFKELLVDSGAFSFFSDAGLTRARRKKQIKEPVAYTHEYCKWIKKHKEDIDHFVELDIDKVVGWEKQLELRKIFDDYNLVPIYVWHYMNKMSWEDMCRKYDYIGLGSSGKQRTLPFIIKKLKIAEKHETDVHIFGYTSIKTLPKIAKMKSLYSVDSSSWGSGIKYGIFYYFDGRNLQQIGRDTFVKKFGKRFGNLTPDQIQKWNAINWNNYANYLVAQGG